MMKTETTASLWDEIQTPDTHLNVRLASSSGTTPCFYAKNSDNQLLFIMELRGDHLALFRKKSFKPRGLELDLLQDSTTSIQRLVIKLGDRVNQDLFDALCTTLIQKVEQAKDDDAALTIALEHLKRWQSFLAQHHTKLSEEAQRGLFAELTLLDEILRHGSHEPVTLMKCWTGPVGGAQDLVIADISVEVKSISGSNRERVRISSEEQLTADTLRLFLRIYRLDPASDDTSTARSLNQKVSAITDLLAHHTDARLCFESKLADYGYIPLPDYDYPLITILQTYSYEVRDDFPRLTRQDLPDGVTKVCYELELEHLKPYQYASDDLLGEI